MIAFPQISHIAIYQSTGKEDNDICWRIHGTFPHDLARDIDAIASLLCSNINCEPKWLELTETLRVHFLSKHNGKFVLVLRSKGQSLPEQFFREIQENFPPLKPIQSNKQPFSVSIEDKAMDETIMPTSDLQEHAAAKSLLDLQKKSEIPVIMSFLNGKHSYGLKESSTFSCTKVAPDKLRSLPHLYSIIAAGRMRACSLEYPAPGTSHRYSTKKQ